MFTIDTQAIKKLKTQAWASATFPAIHSQSQLVGITVSRRQHGLEIDVNGAIVEINKQSLEMGNFRLDGLEGLAQSVQRSAWAVVEEMKNQIDAFTL